MKNNNNIVNVTGIVGDLEYEYEINGETFYKSYITVSRTSKVCDLLPIVISNKLLGDKEYDAIKNTKAITLKGEYRSRNVPENGKSKLQLYIFVQEVSLEDEVHNNACILKGYICKPVILRDTPLGRTITDIMLAVNRNSSYKSDYIPIITWGRNANFASKLKIGDCIIIEGRIQSRFYNKCVDGKNLVCTAYEVSANNISLCCGEEK